MTKQVVIVDYGIGNVYSVSRAIEHCGGQPLLTCAHDEIGRASHVILPGVGAFADGMKELESRGLIPVLKEYSASGRPFMGICLGMQMLLDSTEEFGVHAGLGLIPGKVLAIPKNGADGAPHKIPHIGWNRISPTNGGSDPLLKGLSQTDKLYGYFVHSFTAFPENESNRLADCDYDGCRISAIVKEGLTYGCQFHPEKSGEIGLTIVRNFLAL